MESLGLLSHLNANQVIVYFFIGCTIVVVIKLSLI